MDIAMAAVLLGCFGLMKAFTEWCSRQVDIDTHEKGSAEVLPDPGRERRSRMILLGIIILLIAAYLLYALVHPEKL